MIVFENVSKRYKMGDGIISALSNVSLKVEKGEFAALTGESGSGKSTLMNIAGCLDVPTEGNIKINGCLVKSLTDNEKAELRNRTIGFVFQSFYLQEYLTAAENIMLPMVFGGANSQMRAKRAAELLKLVGMSDRAEHKPSQLSGGQRQRVCIARALANNPKIILADEPTGNLDSGTAEGVMSILKNLSCEGITVLMVTHNTNHVKYADRVYSISDGVLK